MPIITEKAQHIDFKYHPETEDSDYVILVKYHATDLGPTISLSEDNEQWFDFPASLFAEVVDFLRNQYGELGGEKEQIKKVPKTQLFKSKPKIPEFIKRQQQVNEDDGNNEENVQNEDFQPVEVADINEIENLSALAGGHFTGKSGVSQGKNLARMINTRGTVQSSKNVGVPIKKGYAGSPLIVVNDGKENIEKQAQNIERRPVMRNNSDANKMSADELHDLELSYKQLRSFNENSAVNRV